MNIDSATTRSLLIKKRAQELGFDLCGIAPVQRLNEWEGRFRNWLNAAMNGEMTYLTRNIEKRSNPALLVENASSIIVTGLNYYPGPVTDSKDMLKISKYAWGDDYHEVIKTKLTSLFTYIRELIPEVDGRVFTDSAPIFEKAWGQRAGLGWVGKNSILINPDKGSFFFLGEIIINTELQYDNPFGSDNCGNCNVCVEACPTNAITSSRTIDARRCISYLTVENKSEIPVEFEGKTDGWIYGCDECQDVCPWNSKAKKHDVSDFLMSDIIGRMNISAWATLTPEQFKDIFRKSAIKRSKYDGFSRNIRFAINSINKKG